MSGGNSVVHCLICTSLSWCFRRVVRGRKAASERLRVIQNFQVLELRNEALELGESFITQNALPQKASDDALHIALATIYGIDYLLTWNCKHMANAEIQKKIAKISLEQGYEIPTICTPYELMGE